MILAGAVGLAAAGGIGYWALMRGGPAPAPVAPPAAAATPTPATPAPADSAATPAQPVDGTFVIGSADAPVTVIEYASMTCPHCSSFTLTTFPEVKKQFIDTGKVRFVFRDFPLDAIALRASMLVRCAGADKSEALVEMLFRTQQSWSRAADPIVALKQTLRLAGLGDAKADACLADEALKMAVIQSRYDAEKSYQIKSTPSFVIGKTVASGALTIEEFTKFLKDNGLKD
ncbi:disulfide bond formation protein DsbA [Zavarzinia aquatilis]|uniref:Disulfide bond formation protein DsbA n=2 Tax=Zavarzinia aquatilis TaxID=2211142 RepID=A0A317E9R9_9PROT|nr:disulfide bond formation protein DsbA [Zavarzinia aquatilis]